MIVWISINVENMLARRQACQRLSYIYAYPNYQLLSLAMLLVSLLKLGFNGFIIHIYTRALNGLYSQIDRFEEY